MPTPRGPDLTPHEETRTTLHTFTPDRAAALAGPPWLVTRRTEAAEELATMPMPSEKEEVWRYTPIDELRLDEFAPAPIGAEVTGTELRRAFVAGLRADLSEKGPLGAVVHVVDGVPVDVEPGALADGVRVGPLDVLDGETDVLGTVLSGGDALVKLNDAFHPGVVVVDVPARAAVAPSVLIVHWSTGGPADANRARRASLPRTLVRLGDRSQANVVEVVAGPPDAHGGLVVPVTELVVGDAAQLSYVNVQVLGTDVWHIGRLAALAGRDATLKTFTVGLGAAYDRSRVDASAGGPGSSTELRSAYLGTGTQIHDIRTLQDHAAAHTTSDLLCKGAVADRSRSVYSGLIRVRHGAVRTEAFQTNHNLVLSEGAHADSVPNLDIEENDVRCSHASTVGPIDEDQRYYLESRGIPPERAEQLIVLGFFDDIIQRAPVPSVVDRLRREVGLRLADTLALAPGAIRG